MKNRYLFGVSILFSLLLGAIAMWGYQTYTSHKLPEPALHFNSVFDDPFFAPQGSLFDEMERLRKQMDKSFGRPSAFPDIDAWFNRGFGNESFTGIRTEEDGQYLFYILDIEGKKVSNFTIETVDGYVSIEAELESNSPTMSSSTTLSQRFPIPDNVDPGSVSVEQLDDEIRMRFTKQ